MPDFSNAKGSAAARSIYGHEWNRKLKPRSIFGRPTTLRDMSD
jgi:hypothetical protein